MNNTESKIFSEETGHYYNNFSRSGKEMVRNDANASALEKQTGNVCLGESLASLPGVLTEKQFREFVENKVDFRISLPSAYVDGGRIELPNGYSGPNNIYECKDDLRLSFANFIKEVCTKGSTYLKQIKKWNHDGKWVATFDFSSKKPENVHLVYDGEVKSIPLNEQEKIAKKMASLYGRDSITHKIDEFVNYNDFFSKYDALDPQCYEPVPHSAEDGILIGELVEPITKDNRSRLGRIDVDFANLTSDKDKKSEKPDEVFRSFFIYTHNDEAARTILASEKSDKGFLPHTSLLNPEGEPYGFLLKVSETENWLPLYVNVYLWQHRREWLYGQRPYFFGLVFGDIAKCERECYEKRNKKQLQVILPEDMKGNLGAQLREVYFAFREWKTGCKNTADCNIDDALLGEAASKCASLTTAWNLLNEGKYENFSKVVECLDSIRKEFPSYKPSYDDIIKCFYSSTNQASSQAQQVLEMRTLKSTLGILCSYGICSEDNDAFSNIEGNDAFSNKLEYMCADLEMAELLEKDLYPREKAYQRLKRVSEKQPMPTYTPPITIPTIFNFDCFDCLFKQYAIDKIDQWKREFKSSDEADLIQKLAEADKSDIQRMKDRADEETIRAKKSEEELQVQKAMGTSVAHEINNRLDHALSNLKELSDVCISETTKIKKIIRFIRPISTRVHLIRYAYGNKEKLSGDTMTLQLKQIVVDALHEALEDIMGKTDSPYRKNYVKSGCDKNAVINNEIGASTFDFTQTYFDFIYEDDGSPENIHTYHDYIAVISLLLHEYLLNAIKNTSFLPKEERRIQLKITSENKKLFFSIQNTFDAEYKDEKNYFSEHGISLTKCLLQKVGEICSISPDGNEYNVCFSVNLPE